MRINILLGCFFLLIGVVFSPLVQAQEYFECVVTSSSQGVCAPYKNTRFECQLYSRNDFEGECASVCYKASGIPVGCAQQEIRKSRHPVTRADWTGMSNDSIIEYDEDEIEDFVLPFEIPANITVDLKEELERLESITDEAKGVMTNINSSIGNVKKNFINKLPFIGEEDEDDIAEWEKLGEDFDQEVEAYESEDFSTLGFNEFKTNDNLNEGTTVAKIIDPYGVGKYTSDGKHYYDNEYDAAHSQEGLSNIGHKVSGAWDNFKGFFSLKTKFKDKDKELQREIAREVLKEAKTKRDEKTEKVYEDFKKRLGNRAPKGFDVPADMIVMAAKEANETDFAEGVMYYISERKAGKSGSNIRDNSSEILSDGFGTFGKGVSASTTSKQATAVLYARYEQSYQRYLLAKELGRTE